MNKLIFLIVLVLCGLLLQSCFNFADYGADKHYELKHTMEYDHPDSLFQDLIKQYFPYFYCA